jgi:hypothetical protein
LAKIGLSPEVNHALQRRMMVPVLPDLHKQDLASEMINDFLVTFKRPPLRGIVELPARRHDPEGCVFPSDLLNLRPPGLLKLRNINVALEGRRPNSQIQPLAEELGEAMDEVPGFLIASMDNGIMTLDNLGFRVSVIDSGYERIVLPKL